MSSFLSQRFFVLWCLKSPIFFLPFGRGAMLSVRKRWLIHASHPHLPIHALLSVPSVLIYNTREAPCSSLELLSKYGNNHFEGHRQRIKARIVLNEPCFLNLYRRCIDI